MHKLIPQENRSQTDEDNLIVHIVTIDYTKKKRNPLENVSLATRVLVDDNADIDTMLCVIMLTIPLGPLLEQKQSRRSTQSARNRCQHLHATAVGSTVRAPVLKGQVGLISPWGCQRPCMLHLCPIA
jgi:hypothetical protein